jgi:transcriptional regulator with XRE-family HTH domain
MPSLGDRLRTSRQEKGLNLTEAAEQLQVARTAYRLWERDAATPSPEHWNAIALWCDVPLATLLRDLGLLSTEEEDVLLRLAARELRRRN